MLLGITFSCNVNEYDPDRNIGECPEGQVDVTFSVCLPEPVTLEAKSLGETPVIQNLYLAVFGGSGYLKEYVKAEALDGYPTESAPQYNSNSDSSRIKQYKVRLTMSSSKRYIHFIANGPSELPFLNQNVAITQLASSNGDDAYWQMITLDNGILAKTSTRTQDYTDHRGNTVVYGDYIDANDDLITNGTGYVVSDETAAALSPTNTYTYTDGDTTQEKTITGIPLIRNFAKIVITSNQDSHFTLRSFAIINNPTSGTVAPYTSSSGFITDYDKKSYTDLTETLLYPGFMPTDVQLDKTIPTHQDFLNAAAGNESNGAIPGNAGGYMYEITRPTSDDATYVIIYGTYTDPETNLPVDRYYKVDLMDKGDYYPVFRNFKFQIRIEKVLKEGATTPEDAANSNGSGDVSASKDARNLTDISDGQSRIQVQWIAKTFTQQKTETLWYKFETDVNSSDRATHNNVITDPTVASNRPGVTVELLPSEHPVVNGELSVSNSDVNGQRTITFNTLAPGTESGVQTIRITGYHADGTKVYRDITLTLISEKELIVTCEPREIENVIKTPVDIKVSIPKDLYESMFPLIFYIESSALSITPYHDNLPVESGASIWNPSKKSSFHFVKTLSYSDYLALPNSSNAGKVDFVCHFMSNVANSDCTVYVTDKAGYFKTNLSTPAAVNYDSFTTYTKRTFRNLTLPTLQQDYNQPVNFTFTLDAEDPGEITVNLVGLRPRNTELPNGASQRLTGSGPYIYTTTGSDQNRTLTLYLETTVNDGNAKVTLNANHYEEACLSTLSFTGSFGSGAVYAKSGSPVPFSFSYGSVTGIEPVTMTLSGIVPNPSDTRFIATDAENGIYRFTPLDENRSQSITFLSTEGSSEASLTMTSNRHTPFSPEDKVYSKANFNPSFSSTPSIGIGNTCTFTFSYVTDYREDVYITLAGLKPQSSDTRFTAIDADNGRYLYSPTENNLTQTITFETTEKYGTPTVYMSADPYNNESISCGKRLTIQRQALYLYRGSTNNNRRITGDVTLSINGTNIGTITLNTGTNSNAVELTIPASLMNSLSDSSTITFSYLYNNYDNYTANSTLGTLLNATSTNRLTLTLTT